MELVIPQCIHGQTDTTFIVSGTGSRDVHLSLGLLEKMLTKCGCVCVPSYVNIYQQSLSTVWCEHYYFFCGWASITSDCAGS